MKTELFDKFKARFPVEHGKKALLAVSGGIDSMVMLNLFHRLKIHCAVAHCNFQLRGSESDGDEAFVQEEASKIYVKTFVTKFETNEYASENHLSIQMAARELRYTWFEKLAKAHQFDYIAVAHNRDDAIETFFINLGRGSGIAGLTGIQPVSGNTLRPLLFASRADIKEYATAHNISYREDSSNASDKYLRNYIRHQIIPELEEVFPHFRESMSLNLEKLNDAHAIYQQSVSTMLASIVRDEGKIKNIDIPLLLQTPAPKTILFEILKNYGFSPPTIDEVYQAAHATPGKQFLSSTHKVIKDRGCFIITKLETDNHSRYYIEEGTTQIDRPLPLSFETIENDPGFTIEKNPSVAYLDCEGLSFPLILRKWQAGDYFYPLGMNGIKKLSDFFIDIKLSVIEKENTWLLTSGDQIAWVAGKRISDKFKVTAHTKRIIKIAMLKS